MSKWEFHWLLGREEVERSYDLEELEADLNTLENLKCQAIANSSI
jgi:predicted HTH domain antitoxin